MRQERRSTNKVLILDSTVNGGENSREFRAVVPYVPRAQIHLRKPEEWRTMTAEQFMEYRTIIIGDAGCQSGEAAFQAAIDTRRNWGAIIDGDVVIVSTDPTTNRTPRLVENAIRVALESVQYRTGMYIALGCAYQNAPPNTQVALLEPFGNFKVSGVPGCASTGHIFQMSPPWLSNGLSDGALRGDGCVARSVFTSYPDHTFAFAALATGTPEAPIPGERSYIDYQAVEGVETPFVGTPYVLVKGATALSAGCGDQDHGPPEETCDSGDGGNGQPAPPGQDPSTTCSFACRLNWCGDGIVDEEFGEQCDQGVYNGRTHDASGSIGSCSGFCMIPDLRPPNNPPVARCKNVTVAATNTCDVPADVNDGSNDPDGDLVGCTQNPPGPYLIGRTTVVLSCRDQAAQIASCTGTVTVTDMVAPTVRLEGPASEVLECTQSATYPDPGAIARDVCEGPLPVTTEGSVDMARPGSYARTYSARDSAGNVGSATRTVRVADTLSPSITVLEPVEDSMECGAPYVDPGATADDMCAGPLPVTVTRTGRSDRPGTFTLSYSAVDPAGHAVTSPVSRTVQVVDQTPPTLALVEPVMQTVECATPWTEPGVAATDACFGDLTPAIIRSGSVNAGTPGSYLLTYNVTDPAGQSAAPLQRTVHVRDTLAPSITVLGALSEQLQCDHAPYADPGATATDSCAGSLTAAIERVGGVNTGLPGSYVLRYRVADPSGNQTTSPDVRTVNVVDDLPPVITLNGPPSSRHECGAPYDDPGATASDVCAGDLTPSITRTGAVNAGELGSYTLRYTVSDPANLTASTQRTVAVNDTLTPVLSLRGPASSLVECGQGYVDPGATAMDQCAGNLDARVQVSGVADSTVVGDYSVTYAVADFAGNAATPINRQVQVRDTQPPSITIRWPLTQRSECGTDYEDPGATASDVCAGDLTAALQTVGTVNTRTPGSYTLSYTVTDPSGNRAVSSEVRRVTVVDDQPPVLQLLGSANMTLECGSAYEDPGAKARDACAGDLSEFIRRTGVVNAAVPGAYTLRYTVSDPARHSVAVLREVSVADTRPPTIVCPEPLVIEAPAGTEAVVPPRDATASDVCSPARVSRPTQTRFPIGATELTYTATDVAGNTATCTTTITVLAIAPPVPVPDLDRALMGGGNGCSSTGSGPSSLAMIGLGMLAVLLNRKRTRALLPVLAVLLGSKAIAQPQGDYRIQNGSQVGTVVLPAQAATNCRSTSRR
jgi:uncharacterized protein (TIGR03382 family)